jgi:hypothetical protein
MYIHAFMSQLDEGAYEKIRDGVAVEDCIFLHV